jgi:K+-sensing histidine kinase KdpD
MTSEGNTGIMQNFSLAENDNSQAVLLRSVAEQLKTPLMYLARQAELGAQTADAPDQIFKTMQIHADMSLRLVDSYLLGLDITNSQTALELEPVSVSAALYDIAHDLTPLAKQYNTDVELVLAGKYGQVMAHPAGLRAALYGLGFVLSEVAHPDKIRNTLRIAAHRTRNGIVTGVYIEGAEKIQTSLAHAQSGQSVFKRQPFAQLTAGTGAGIFVADTIFSAMQTKLRSGKFRNQQGLAVTLQPSQQLQLI